MSEHTPGPWGRRIAYQIRGKDDTSEVAIYQMPWNGGSERRIASWKMNGPLDDEAEANARLIAAAPNLLAALEALVYAYVELADSSTGREAQMQRIPAMVKAVQEAEQAIAEATA
jgi:hypothetical protein